MRKSGSALARASVGVLVAGLLVAAALVAPAVALAGSTSSSTCSSSAGKCFAVAVAPASVAAGASQSFTFTITNEATTQQLGSVKITAPSGFMITAAPGAATVTSGSALFTNLAVPPTGNTTLTVTATASCGGGSYTWGMEVKQSNDFSGPPGNDFQFDASNSTSLSGTATGTCSLAFSGEPAGTAAGHVITTGFNSSGGPVQVEILDGNGNLATNSAAPITVGLSSNPGSGSLSGTTTVNASAGVASFTDLSINAAGVGYTLLATSTGIASATSMPPFAIYGSIGGCSASCSGSASGKSTAGTVTTSSGTAGDLLGIGVGGVSYTCNSSYQPVSDPVNVDLLDASGKPLAAQFNATLEIFKNAVQASGHPGASTWQVCYADTSSFPVRPGTAQSTAVIGGVTYYTGLLPDCSSTQPAPCVQARNKDNAGDVLVTILAAGDLVFRG
jgi:hypothetical protein